MFEDESYVFSSNKCDWLYNRFNSTLKDKVLVCIEEMKKTKSKSDWMDAYDKIKDLTTNPKVMIEFKGKDEFECASYFDFIITSNHYNNILLEVENRRYFIPTVSPIRDKKIESLCNYVNGIIIGGKNKDIPMEQKEKRKYFRCFFAYCKENFDKEFDSSDIPITEAVIQNNEKSMDVIYKYVKIGCLYNKKYLTTDKEGNKIFKIIFNTMKDELTSFITDLDKNEKNLKRYNYCQHPINNFKHELNKSRLEITTNFLTNHIKFKFGDEYVKEIRVKNKEKDTKYSGFVISYDELLEIYKTLGYVDADEYEMLKGNYKYINYFRYENDETSSGFSLSSQIEELKQKIEEKDELIKKYIEELKEKDRTFENLKSFTNEQKDKEIEKLKTFNEDLDTKIKEFEEIIKVKNKTIQENIDIVESKDKEIEKIKNELEEIKKINSNNSINEEKEKIKEIIKPKINDLFKQYKKCVETKYSKINESNQTIGFINSLKTSKKQIEEFKKKGINMDMELLGKQQQEEKEIKSKFEDLLKF